MTHHFGADAYNFILSMYKDELDRLEVDCAEAIFLTPDHLDKLIIVNKDGLEASVGDRVGWVACLIRR